MITTLPGVRAKLTPAANACSRLVSQSARSVDQHKPFLRVSQGKTMQMLITTPGAKFGAVIAAVGVRSINNRSKQMTANLPSHSIAARKLPDGPCHPRCKHMSCRQPGPSSERRLRRGQCQRSRSDPVTGCPALMWPLRAATVLARRRMRQRIEPATQRQAFSSRRSLDPDIWQLTGGLAVASENVRPAVAFNRS